MKIFYSRVSTLDQNNSRQIAPDGYDVFEDKISGSVAFADRPAGSKIVDLSASTDVEEVMVHSIDRLGRNTLDILKTIEDFTALGINVVSVKEGLSTLLPSGKQNPTAKLMINILATIAEFERERLLERQREGIALAKQKGVYQGRSVGSTEEEEVFLNKKKTQNALREINRGFSVRRAAKLSGTSPNFIVKVRGIAEKRGLLKVV